MAIEEAVRERLGKISYPDSKDDLVSLGVVREVRVEDSTAKIILDLKDRNPELRHKITTSIRSEIGAIEGIKNVAMEIGLPEPKPRPKPSHVPSDKTAPKLLSDIRYKIAVASGKGGVGKSTVATNLALALSKRGARVGLLDADIYGPNIPIMMGVSGKPKAQNNRVLPMDRFGIKLMSIGFFLEENAPVVWRGPMVGKAIEQFMRDVIWDDVDFFVVDMPPGTGDAQLSLSSLIKLDGSIIVTTPQDVALADAIKGVAMFEKVDVKILGIVENMSFFICPHCQERTEIFDHGGGERTSKNLKVPFLGGIPLDPAIRKGGDSGEPIMEFDPESPQSKAFLKIADEVLKALPLN